MLSCRKTQTKSQGVQGRRDGVPLLVYKSAVTPVVPGPNIRQVLLRGFSR